MSKYIFDDDKKQLYCALIIIDAIVDKGSHFVTNLLSEDEQKLLPIFQRMIDKGILTIDDMEHEYKPTDKGIDLIHNFYDRYQEFVKFYDIYCAVDLTVGKFAFSEILDMTEEEFQEYLKDDRWEDVRVAVCEFKKIDPMQMVFLSFLRENRIDVTKSGWIPILLNGDIWNDITKICDSAITLEKLSVEDQIKNIVIQGSDLLKTLLEREKNEKNNDGSMETETTTITEETTQNIVDDDDLSYYDPYFDDPFYISPCWGYYYYTPVWW